MSDLVLVGTRKGLFTIRRNGRKWGIENTAFLGEPVPMALPDARDGAFYCALDLGHFGSKLHRSGTKARPGRNARFQPIPHAPKARRKTSAR